MSSPAVLMLFLSSSLQILWSIPAVLLKLCRVHLYQVTNQEDVTRLRRTLQGYSSIIVDGEKPSGFLCGRWYIGFLHQSTGGQRGGGQSSIYLLTTRSSYQKLTTRGRDDMTEVRVDTQSQTVKINFWERNSVYWNLDYNKRVVTVRDYQAELHQQKAIRLITGHFQQHLHTVVYLHGRPGTGKSMIGLLLAKKLEGHFCKSWNPTEPSDRLAKVYQAVSPTRKNPLILVLEEFDGIIKKIINGKLEHKHISIPVKDKASWNSMLDDINLGLYPNLILVLTSNQGPEWVRQQDKSFIREGRVDIIRELDGQHHQ